MSQHSLILLAKSTFLINEIVVFVSLLSSVQFFCSPMDYIVCEAPLSLGFSRQEYWNGLPFPFPVVLLDTGIEPMPPALAGEFFITEPPGKPINGIIVPSFLVDRGA